MIRNPDYKSMAILSLCDALLTDSDSNVRYTAAESLGIISSEDAIPALSKALKDGDVRVRQKAAEVLGKICSPDQLSELDILQILKNMSEIPKVKMEFNAPVYGAAGNVEGNQIVNVSEQNLVDAAVEIRNLLNQLAQSYPSVTEEITVETLKEEIKRNPTLKARLINAFKSGGVEALKTIFNHPLVSVPIEIIKGFLEAEAE